MIVTTPYKPSSMQDVLINDPASRNRLQGVLDGRPPFPGTGINGIMLHGATGTGKTTLANLLPEWLERSGNLPRTIFTAPAVPVGAAHYASLVHCGKKTSGVAANSGLTLQKRLSLTEKEQMWHSPSGWHYEILDEVQALKLEVLTRLPSMMSGSPTTIFVLTTNDLQKLNRAVSTRCHLIEMNQMQALEDYVPVAARLLAHHNLSVKLPDHQVMALAAKAQGSLRDFENALVAAASA